MKATAVIFSYLPDYLATAYAARALIRNGVRVVVAVDRRDPMPVIGGCEVVATTFPRRGNLNGKACVEGILATMEAAARPDDEWVLKVDADALTLRMRWLDYAPYGVEVVGMGHGDKHLQFGFCYAIRRSALPALRERASRLPKSESCPEDCTIGGLAKSFHRYQNLQPDCPMAAFPWDDKRPREWWKERYDVLCFQRVNGRGRREVAEEMKAFLQ